MRKEWYIVVKDDKNSSELSKDDNQLNVESAVVFTSSQVKSLREHWLATVEQVISAAATVEGRRGLERLLNIERKELEDIIGRLSKMLAPEVLEEISKPAAQKPLGVIFDEPQSSRNLHKKGDGK